MPKKPLTVDALTHDEDTRKNAPTAELEAFVDAETKRPIQVAYERRNQDLDPQLIWRGKDVADWSELVVNAPPLYIQEKIHPKALIEDLKRASTRKAEPEEAPDLFADFNGLEPEQRTEFYQHDQHWSNRMILGDGLQVMASLAERENLKGQVQCIYIDPPYGIKFNSNFQWSTTSRDVKDGKADHLTREPEQVKAFRDTWRDGIHSYLTYLRDRLTVARDLLTESGSVFVQIGDENIHRVRALMDEVFGDDNFKSLIHFQTNSGLAQSVGLATTGDYVLWYARNASKTKYRQPYFERPMTPAAVSAYSMIEWPDTSRQRKTQLDDADSISTGAGRLYRYMDISKPGPGSKYEIEFEGKIFEPGKRWWGTTPDGIERMRKARRLGSSGKTLWSIKYFDDFAFSPHTSSWDDTASSFASDKVYVVQTSPKVIERCVLMTTDPGDLVLDPTCGSGTTAYVAEQWGRRWITIDTSRVALALARSRLMGARYPWYLLADSPEGQKKEAEVTRTVPSTQPTYGRIRQGFVYKRVPHITLKSIANNAEIDTIWEQWQPLLENLLDFINRAAGQEWVEWTIPRELPGEEGETMVRIMPEDLGPLLDGIHVSQQGWSDDCRMTVREVLGYYWKARVARQKEIDASIATKADNEYLYDQPYTDNARVRVAGPFTVESLSPHRVPAVDVDDSLFDELEAAEGRRQKDGSGETADFAEMVLENLKRSGVQQPHKADRLVFESLRPWPGKWICAEGQVRQASLDEADEEPSKTGAPLRRAAILVGPEYGTVSRPDLVAAAREAAESGFDLLIAAAFNFDAHSSEYDKMGALTVLQARINPDLHMPDLANTGAGNLFTVFGEPDIEVHEEEDGLISVEVAGVDMYKAGQIESSDADDIAVWFVDTDYDYENFRVRQAYFPGANDPYKALKTTLKAEIDADAWASLNRTRSRTFERPENGRIAVKVINHLGDEVMKVLEV